MLCYVSDTSSCVLVGSRETLRGCIGDNGHAHHRRQKWGQKPFSLDIDICGHSDGRPAATKVHSSLSMALCLNFILSVGYHSNRLNSVSNARNDISGLFRSFLDIFFLKQILRSFDLSTYYSWFLKWNRTNIKDNLKGWITSYRENEFILALFPLCSISLKKHSFRQRANSVPTWISAAAPRIRIFLRRG